MSSTYDPENIWERVCFFCIISPLGDEITELTMGSMDLIYSNQ
jgi:hypothetical protein